MVLVATMAVYVATCILLYSSLPSYKVGCLMYIYY